jgi:hypothetical protein
MIRADFSSLGATAVILEVQDDDNHLISSNYLANASWLSVNSLFPQPCTNINTTTYSYWQTPDHICYRFCKYGCNCLGTNCYVERIACLRPDIAFRPTLKYLNDVQMLGASALPPGGFAVQSEEFGMFGLRHKVAGQATFEARPGILILNNLGASGHDGVTVDLHHVGQFDMSLAPTMLEVQGACWQMSASGLFNGTQGAPLGSTALVHSVGPGGGCLVSDDFGALGASHTQIEIYLGGQLVGTVTESNGVLGSMPTHGNLIGCGMLMRPLPGFKARFDASFVFLPANGSAQISGDELHFLAADPVAPVQGLAQFSVSGCNLNQFAILGETAQPAINGMVQRSDGSFEIDGVGIAGMTYRLEGTSTLGSTTQWMPVSSATAGPDGGFHLFDARAGNFEQQFYHVVSP